LDVVVFPAALLLSCSYRRCTPAGYIDSTIRDALDAELVSFNVNFLVSFEPFTNVVRRLSQHLQIMFDTVLIFHDFLLVISGFLALLLGPHRINKCVTYFNLTFRFDQNYLYSDFRHWYLRLVDHKRQKRIKGLAAIKACILIHLNDHRSSGLSCRHPPQSLMKHCKSRRLNLFV